MGKVYRKYLEGSAFVLDGTTLTETLIDTFVAEENLKIIGWQHRIYHSNIVGGYPTADDAVYLWATLTFAAQGMTDALVSEIHLSIGRYMFGSPASGAGWHNTEEGDETMLPAGSYLDMKEGEHLNLFLSGRNGLGVDNYFHTFAIIYYERGR